MSRINSKKIKRQRRRGRIRAKIKGTSERPRLSVFKSNKGMYLQLIDDSAGKTLVSARSGEIKAAENKDSKMGKKTGIGLELGKLLAQKAGKAGLKLVVFDRGGYKFHGRIKAVADGARAGGLEF